MESDSPSQGLSQDLIRFAESGGPEERRSVIVELAGLPPPVARRSGAPKPRPPAPPAAKSRIPILAEIEGSKSKMDALESSLLGLALDESPVRLDAAQAFVVKVAPAQLRELVGLPHVGAVLPNREHQVIKCL